MEHLKLKKKKEIEDKVEFEFINMNKGDLLIFNNKCPHRSDNNNSNKNRRILYFTYNPIEYGDNYNIYYNDKKYSDNSVNKSLSKK